MPASGIAAPTSELNSRFLEGIGPPDLKVILAAAKPRQFPANSIIVSQGNPADYLYFCTY